LYHHAAISLRMLFVDESLGLTRLSFSPPASGGGRGGKSEGKNLKKKLIRLTHTSPNLPLCKGRSQTRKSYYYLI
ncbi:MAG: hypothetical protein AAB972_01365, partial [Patescibacteria group bacterium]